MFCLISQPNNVIIEIRIDPKAIGQECLMKVGVFIIIGNKERIGFVHVRT